LLPAGPLREPAARISEADLIVSNGRASGVNDEEAIMSICPKAFVHLGTGQRLRVEAFTERYVDVHAVAGIGNPNRFAHTLRELGLKPLVHPFKDHHRYTGAEIEFADDWPIVCTEKDAVKLGQIDAPLDRCWYLEIDVAIEAKDEERLTEIFRTHAILR
jgi:tetraacyldisaccharide 4'-kinase